MTRLAGDEPLFFTAGSGYGSHAIFLKKVQVSGTVQAAILRRLLQAGIQLLQLGRLQGPGIHLQVQQDIFRLAGCGQHEDRFAFWDMGNERRLRSQGGLFGNHGQAVLDERIFMDELVFPGSEKVPFEIGQVHQQ
jgi:hypothetical protein